MSEPLEYNSYTYEDYLEVPNSDEKIELIDGAFCMSPAPLRIHQEIIMNLSYEIQKYIKENGGSCKVYVAPFDVRLDATKGFKARNVVQPDISVICDESKLDERGCNGAPNLIIEVVSPSNSSLDYVTKLNLYNKFKVNEYWIVNPNTKTVLVYRSNEDGVYEEPEKYIKSDIIKVNIFTDLCINLNSIFL